MVINDILLSELVPYEKNPRNNKDSIELVANSIKEFGFKVPIVIDKNNVIVAGHTRYLASKLLGLDKVPCIVADDLTEEQIKAFRLADNKVGEGSTWEDDILKLELDDIAIDMEKFGFFDDEILDNVLPEIEEKPEIEFTEVMNEENNYIILQFKTDVDWLQALTVFDIEPKKALSTRQDGKITKSMERVGTGRVLDGAKVLKKLTGGLL